MTPSSPYPRTTVVPCTQARARRSCSTAHALAEAGDVVVSAVAAGGHGPELEERAARETRMEECSEDGGVHDDVAAGQVVEQVVERLERVRQVVREADIEHEQRVSKVAVREEARICCAGVEAVAEARGLGAV
jgi:hypothetical protein